MISKEAHVCFLLFLFYCLCLSATCELPLSEETLVPLPPSLSVECGESLGEDWERGRWEREEEVPGKYKSYEWVNTKICKKKLR